jgi:hypothetical protein
MISLVSDKRISAQCFRVLCYLATKAGDKGEVKISTRAIAAGCSIDQKTVLGALCEAYSAKLLTSTSPRGVVATYRLSLPDGKSPPLEKIHHHEEEEEDDGGEWTAGEGDSSKLAELMVSRLNAADSDTFKHAACRLINWIRHGESYTPSKAFYAEVPSEAASKRIAKSVFIRVAIAEHVLGLRTEASMVAFSAASGVHRSAVYRGLASLRSVFGIELQPKSKGVSKAPATCRGRNGE